MGNGELLREILCAGWRHGAVDGKIKGGGRGVTLKGTPKYTAGYQPKFVMAFTAKLSERSRPFPTERFIVGSQQ